MSEVLLVMCNAPDLATARTLAGLAVDRALAACANIMSPCESTYRWKGAVEQAAEVPLIFKTTRSRYGELESLIRTHHPYDVPEIIAIPVTAGLPDYLDWVRTETKSRD